jgi:hypothetical protein
MFEGGEMDQDKIKGGDLDQMWSNAVIWSKMI